ncbi:OmpA family protein [Celerinatantimonas sp. YJH-8]|uniref:OmpA family protein n=1 Tax=Celerinatantimonas sp. YJH-8 TaxID=3228714 RepID=UPI0038CBA2C9
MRRIHRRRRHLGHREDTHRWLVSYADYMTLMFALFVMLYALAIVNRDRYPVLMEHLSEAVNILSQEQQLPQKPDILPYPQSALQLGEGKRAIAPDVKGQQEQVVSSAEGGEQSIDRSSALLPQPMLPPQLSTVSEKQQGQSLASLEIKLKQHLSTAIQEHHVVLSRSQDWLIIRLDSGLLFASGSASLLNSAKFLLDQLASVLDSANNYIRVRGYTDNQPINTELYGSNWELSVARALHVLRYLTEQGIVPQRLAVEGYGQYTPLMANDSEAHRMENRRVVIALSRYAWVAPKPLIKNATSVPEPSGNSQENRTKADSKTILTIPLQGGGVRYTTRQDE